MERPTRKRRPGRRLPERASCGGQGLTSSSASSSASSRSAPSGGNSSVALFLLQSQAGRCLLCYQCESSGLNRYGFFSSSAALRNRVAIREVAYWVSVWVSLCFCCCGERCERLPRFLRQATGAEALVLAYLSSCAPGLSRAASARSANRCPPTLPPLPGECVEV